MGCGKTTLGKKLAKKLNIKFVDMDAAIEKQEGNSISEIFSHEGEVYFRNLEKKWLEAFNESEALISTGGGAPCFHDNMHRMNQKGVSVYIKLPPKVLVDRLKSQKSQRPLVANKSEEELLGFIEEKLAERSSFYEQAKIHYNGIEDDVEGLVLNLKKFTKSNN